jgi:hypothetical protein
MLTILSSASDRLSTRFVEDVGFLLTNVTPQHTGIEGVVIWFAASEFSTVEGEHGPKLLVVVGDRLTTDSLADGVMVKLGSPPTVLGTLPSEVARQVLEFVEINRQALLRHWTGELDSFDALAMLEPVGPASPT